MYFGPEYRTYDLTIEKIKKLFVFFYWNNGSDIEILGNKPVFGEKRPKQHPKPSDRIYYQKDRGEKSPKATKWFLDVDYFDQKLYGTIALEPNKDVAHIKGLLLALQNNP